MLIIPIHVFQFTSIFISDSWVREKGYLPNLGRGSKRLKNMVLAHAFPSLVCVCVCVSSYVTLYPAPSNTASRFVCLISTIHIQSNTSLLI
jgi:hypothetical protein